MITNGTVTKIATDTTTNHPNTRTAPSMQEGAERNANMNANEIKKQNEQIHTYCDTLKSIFDSKLYDQNRKPKYKRYATEEARKAAIDKIRDQLLAIVNASVRAKCAKNINDHKNEVGHKTWGNFSPLALYKIACYTDHTLTLRAIGQEFGGYVPRDMKRAGFCEHPQTGKRTAYIVIAADAKDWIAKRYGDKVEFLEMENWPYFYMIKKIA